jgi:hypothetical protein
LGNTLSVNGLPDDGGGIDQNNANVATTEKFSDAPNNYPTNLILEHWVQVKTAEK